MSSSPARSNRLRTAWVRSAPGRIALSTLLLCVALVIAIALHPAPFGIDSGVLDYFQSRRTPGWNQFFSAVTAAGSPGVLELAAAVVLVGIAVLRRDWRPLAVGGVAIAGAALTGTGIKFAMGRLRPDQLDRVVGISAANSSFPSGHATVAAAGLLIVALIAVENISRPWVRTATVATAVGLAGLVAFSRIYLGVHWFSDVTGGLLLGWTYATAVWAFWRVCRSMRQAPARGADLPRDR